MRRVKKKREVLSLKAKLWLLTIMVVIGGSVWFYRSDYRAQISQSLQKSYVTLMEKMQLILKQAKINGHIRTKKEDINAVAELSQGMPIFDVDLKDIHDKISALPWIKSVLVERKLPSTLIITVTEKTPIAVWQNNKKYMPLDEEGNPIPDDQAKLVGLLLVVGSDAPKHTARLLTILDRYPDVKKRVKSAVRVGNRRWDLRLDKVDGIVIELPEKNEAEALGRLQISIQKDKLFQKNITSVNLREKDHLIVTVGGKK